MIRITPEMAAQLLVLILEVRKTRTFRDLYMDLRDEFLDEDGDFRDYEGDDEDKTHRSALVEFLRDHEHFTLEDLNDMLVGAIQDRVQEEHQDTPDLVESMVEAFMNPYVRNALAGGTIREMRRKLLLPQEHAKLAEIMRTKVLKCSECGEEFRRGEAVSYYPDIDNVTVYCLRCVRATSVKCHRHGCTNHGRVGRDFFCEDHQPRPAEEPRPTRQRIPMPPNARELFRGILGDVDTAAARIIPTPAVPVGWTPRDDIAQTERDIETPFGNIILDEDPF